MVEKRENMIVQAQRFMPAEAAVLVDLSEKEVRKEIEYKVIDIDEDLSPKTAERLRVDDGLDVIHVRDRSLLGKSDPIILQRAYDEDRFLVTANVKNFQM